MMSFICFSFKFLEVLILISFENTWGSLSCKVLIVFRNLDLLRLLLKWMRNYSICHLTMLKRGIDFVLGIKDFASLKEFLRFSSGKWMMSLCFFFKTFIIFILFENAWGSLFCKFQWYSGTSIYLDYCLIQLQFWFS